MEKIAAVKGVYVGSVLHHAPCYTEFLVSVTSCILHSSGPKIWNFALHPPVVRIIIDDVTNIDINDFVTATRGALISFSVVSVKNGFIAKDVKLEKREAKTLDNFMEDILKIK